MAPKLLILDLEQPCIDHDQAGSSGAGGSGWGYGSAYALTESGRKRFRLHRMVFETYHGYRPPVVMHDCDNPRCINIAHLSPGTSDLNNKDRARKGRSAVNVPSRRRLTDDQVREIRASYVKGPKNDTTNGVMALSRRYGVDTNVIYQVATHRTYKDVA